jgi:hypothetical protein
MVNLSAVLIANDALPWWYFCSTHPAKLIAFIYIRIIFHIVGLFVATVASLSVPHTGGERRSE